jgi:hypothetical protein
MEKTWNNDPFAVAGAWELRLPTINPLKDKSKNILDMVEKALIAGQSILRPLFVTETILHGKLINEAKFQPSGTSPIHKDQIISFTQSPSKIKQLLSDDLVQFEKEYTDEIVFFGLLRISGQALISYYTDYGDLETEWFPPIPNISNLNDFNYKNTFSIGFNFSMYDPESILLSINTTCSIWGFLTDEGNNSDLAKINSPRLAGFLKEIERIFNAPIEHWEGELGMKVGHYGFLPDSLEKRRSKQE